MRRTRVDDDASKCIRKVSEPDDGARIVEAEARRREPRAEAEMQRGEEPASRAENKALYSNMTRVFWVERHGSAVENRKIVMAWTLSDFHRTQNGKAFYVGETMLMSTKATAT